MQNHVQRKSKKIFFVKVRIVVVVWKRYACRQHRDFYSLGGPAPDVAVGLYALTSGFALVNVLPSLPQPRGWRRPFRGEPLHNLVERAHRAPPCVHIVSGRARAWKDVP